MPTGQIHASIKAVSRMHTCFASIVLHRQRDMGSVCPLE